MCTMAFWFSALLAFIMTQNAASEYIGCYTDGGPKNRLLRGDQKNFPELLTPQLCHQFCLDGGFGYAGTQYSVECFCSRSKPPDEKKTQDSECNFKCAGDKSKHCGGADRLSIQSTGFVQPVYPPVEYLGCYVDGGPENRLMSGLQQNFEKTLTQDVCNKLCFDEGFQYSGTQYRIECFCSRTKPPNNKKANSDQECNLKCAGDSKMCGGHNRISIYSTGLNQIEYGTTTYMGCYIDGTVKNRLLNGLQRNFPGTLTPENCNKYCFDKGFAFAGTEYSFECFCAKSKPPNNKKTDDKQCDAKCAGDKSIKCGGDFRLSVYNTGRDDYLETEINKDSKYVGCFKDFSNGTRLMTGYHQDLQNKLTNNICTAICKNKGFRYAGTQYSYQCFCDNKPPSFLHYAKEEDCLKRCDGNYLEICGGHWRLSIFQTGITGHTHIEEAGHYLGCYEDNKEARSLNGHNENFGNIMTPLRCTGLCYSMGYLYAGTQNSNECYCGDEHPMPNMKVSDSECSKPCSGNPTHKCGGVYRNAIRETGIPDYPVYGKYLGCFNDLNNQILKGKKIIFEKNNTPKRCLNYCHQLGFKYSGVEYGKECLCGNEEPNPKWAVNGSDCNMQCSGDPLDTCGAGWRLAVYSTDPHIVVIPIENTTSTTTVSPKPCTSSDTTIGNSYACVGQIIFDEQFDTSLSKWKHVVLVSETPDYEFAVFHASSKNSFVSKGELIIKPTLFEDSFVACGQLTLEGCTGKAGTRECGFQAFSYSVLPPVATARIQTRDSFSFRYGIIEVRAKLPVGDWLIPELWLEPKRNKYGQNYSSGRIRIAMSRGNQNLQCDGKDFGRTRLEFGILMGPENDVRSRSVFSTVPDAWHDYFHTYTLIWMPDQIAFKVDNEPQYEIIPKGGRLCEAIGFTDSECETWATGSNIAPFDTEFFISLGLSSGNARDFPDSCINRGNPKPWRNLEVKALLKFWQDRGNWSSTWTNENAALHVDYVRVTAL